MSFEFFFYTIPVPLEPAVSSDILPYVLLFLPTGDIVDALDFGRLEG